MRSTVVILLAVLIVGCTAKNQVNPELSNQVPSKIVWAWERPEDLRFLEPKDFGVAFLAQTLFVNGDVIDPKPRRQPLEVNPGTYMIAVTRIETNKGSHPAFSEDQRRRIVSLVKGTLDLPDVKAIQIDFDAVVSERAFYRSIMKDLKQALPPATPLTMTSLASWCTGDAWFNDFPVDEAVPMAFQMGADEEKIKTYLRNGNDWNEPLCRGSYGISIDDPLGVPLKPNRRTYYFKNGPWVTSDLERLK
ncbi:MAG: hypothetical protein ABI999_08655 [Acidobacteriota bacterium]